MSDKKTKHTPEQMRRMAQDVIRYLAPKGLFYDVNIHAGGMHYSDSRHHGQEPDKTIVPDIEVWAGESDSIPCEYSNPDTLTMTFEGPLYAAMNHGLGAGYSVYDDLQKLFGKYGLYFEMGHAWSLSCYDL